MAFLYPWGNTQQLNLDWILQKIKELEASGGSGGGGVDLDEVANALISATYSRRAYDRSDIVYRDGKLYRANQAIPAPGEAWTPAHWDEILLGDTVSNLVQYVAALSNDQIANSSNVSGTHTSDALDTLKNAIDNLPLDSDNISNESLVTGDNVSDALDNLNTAISNEATARANVDSAIEGAIAIVANGNTHAAIASGQYVYIKNHGTLAEGLYKATAAIPINGALANTNVSAVTSGGLNDFKAFSQSNTIAPIISGGTVNENECNKTGNIVNICFRHSGFSTDAGSKAWATVPTGYRPTTPMALMGYLQIDGIGFVPARFFVGADGGLWAAYSSSYTCTQICIAGSYPIQE